MGLILAKVASFNDSVSVEWEDMFNKIGGTLNGLDPFIIKVIVGRDQSRHQLPYLTVFFTVFVDRNHRGMEGAQ